MSFGHWGRVLPAHMRKGFTRVFQHGDVPAGSALSCSVGFAGLGAFLSDCPFHILAWNCVARPRAATGFFVWCGAGLVDAVLDRTLGVSNSVGFIWELSLIGHSGCVVR